MKKSLFFITIFLSVFLLILGCAQTRFVDYQPKSAEEKEVFDFMMEGNEAWPSKDVTKVLARYHDKAKIRIVIGTDRNQPIVSKPQFKKYLEEGGFKKMGGDGTKLLNPKITIMEDRATVIMTSRATNVIIRHTWDLVKDREKWCIIRYDWRW